MSNRGTLVRLSRGDDAAAGRPVDALMLALDANNDGALAESEIATASTSLSALDLNKDGKLTREEFLANQPDPDKAPERFIRFDADKSGDLSKEEFVSQGKAAN